MVIGKVWSRYDTDVPCVIAGYVAGRSGVRVWTTIMTQETVTCPAEGCDYDGFKSSVLGHYSGRQDDAHAGGYQKAKTLLDSGDTTQETTETAETDDSTDTSDSPVMGDADPDATTEPDTEGVELPCGHESYNASEAPDPPFAVSCSECGNAWKVQE